jgi:hypothetical protein
MVGGAHAVLDRAAQPLGELVADVADLVLASTRATRSWSTSRRPSATQRTPSTQTSATSAGEQQ